MIDSRPWSDGTRRWDGGDLAAAALLVAIAVAFLLRGPRELYHFDEGLLLYESKRVLDGELIYRDFFEIITPGTLYVVAGAFWLFGTSLATARALDATVQGLILLVMFAVCRRLGVRRAIAVGVGLCHLALASLFMPMLTPHWFGSLLTLVGLGIALAPWSPRKALGLGAATGLLVLFQHQKGVTIGAAALAVALLDAWLTGRGPRPLVRALVGWLAGAAIVLVPVGAALLAAAGLAPVVDALVRFPLQHYHGEYNRPTWGAYMPVRHFVIAARVVASLPILALLDLARGAAGWRAGAGERARRLWTLGIFSAAATLSVAYNPDALHLAIVAPVHLILAAEAIETILSRLGGTPRAQRAIGWAVAAALVVAATVQLEANLRWRRTLFRYPLDTAFGTIDFRTEQEVSMVQAVRQALARSPRRELLVYPFYASLYLLADATNPTRFEILLPGYSPPEHVQEAIAVLEARQVPYVVVQTVHVKWKEDAMVRYLDEHYEPVPLPIGKEQFPTFALFRRRG